MHIVRGRTLRQFGTEMHISTGLMTSTYLFIDFRS